jgi:DNA-binding CsgD family transcriptional regulator
MPEPLQKATRIPAVSSPGLILLDSPMTPVAWNIQAMQILSYPAKPRSTKHAVNLLLGRLPGILKLDATECHRQTLEFASGRRRYSCTVYRLDMMRTSAQHTTAVFLDRVTSPELMLHEVSTRFNLTVREREAVGYLLQGLTSKEVAQKMNISANTVKAFLRLVMTKMAVSTRAGLIGRVAGIQMAPSNLRGEAL